MKIQTAAALTLVALVAIPIASLVSPQKLAFERARTTGAKASFTEADARAQRLVLQDEHGLSRASFRRAIPPTCKRRLSAR